MNERLNPFSSSPGAMQELISLQEYLHAAGFDVAMMGLVRTRVSQINGCAHGIGLHTRRALTHGESEERLFMLDAWRHAACYTERERAALAWAEAVTLISQSHVPDSVFDRARQLFTEEELVTLTMIVAATNAWNRVEISFRTVPGSLQEVRS
jgi:AhpD family alkylhydroperoxidase